MKNWFNRNYKTIIVLAFLIPIIIVAVVSISHVTKWYDISNPVSWATYLSIGIEIAALSSLAAISANMGKKVYFPFAIVTLIQFIGNIFFSYQYIDINGQLFKDWVDLVSPLLSTMGIEPGDYLGHKRFLALFSGGLLPVISLSFLHMLIKFTDENKKELNNSSTTGTDNQKFDTSLVDAKDIISEVSKIRLTDEELKQLEEFLLKPKEVKEIDNNSEEQDLDEEIKDIIEQSTSDKYNESYDFENEEGSIEDNDTSYDDVQSNIVDNHQSENIAQSENNNDESINNNIIEEVEEKKK